MCGGCSMRWTSATTWAGKQRHGRLQAAGLAVLQPPVSPPIPVRPSWPVSTQTSNEPPSTLKPLLFFLCFRSLNVCYLYETFEDAKCVDLVMELCQGGQLWDQ
jgi:hypothetical protein